MLGARLKQKPASYWLNLMVEVGIPCSAIENVESIAQHPISEEYSAFSQVTTLSGDAMRFARNPIADVDIAETAAPR